jgi:hypothetical protein
VPWRRSVREACNQSGLVSRCLGSRSWFLTSPTAKSFPSGLNETQVAALILSRADQPLPLGESLQSWAGEANGEPPMPASRREAAVRLRLSFWVGVDGPP